MKVQGQTSVRLSLSKWIASAGGIFAIVCIVVSLVAQMRSDSHGFHACVCAEQRAGARREFQELYDGTPNRIDLLSFIGELAVRDVQLNRAAACFAEIPDDHPDYGLSARLQESQVLLR